MLQAQPVKLLAEQCQLVPHHDLEYIVAHYALSMLTNGGLYESNDFNKIKWT